MELEHAASLRAHFFCSYCVLRYPTEEGASIRQEDLHGAGSWKASWPSDLAANSIAQAPQSPSFWVSLNRVMKRPFIIVILLLPPSAAWNQPELSEPAVLSYVRWDDGCSPDRISVFTQGTWKDQSWARTVTVWHCGLPHLGVSGMRRDR